MRPSPMFMPPRLAPLLLAALLTPCICTAKADLLTDNESGFPFPHRPKHNEGVPPTGWKVDAGEVKAWRARDGMALKLSPGTRMERSLAVPLEAGRSRQGMIWAECLGLSEGQAAVVRLEVFGPDGQLMGNDEATVTQAAVADPRADIQIIDASAGDGLAALDGNDRTQWGTGYKLSDTPPLPHHLDLDLGRPRRMKGLLAKPPSYWVEGMIENWALATSPDGKQWTEVETGTFAYAPAEVQNGGPRPWKRVVFQHEINARYVRFMAKSLVNCKQTNLAELDFIWSDPQPEAPAPQRLALHLSPKMMAALSGKSCRLRLSSSGSVVVGGVAFERHFAQPVQGDQEKPNGNSNNDRIACGLLGFEGFSQSGHAGFPVIQTYPNTPATQAGLTAGDLIVGVGGQPLPRTDCQPGWTWFHSGHEAVIGRACLTGLAKGGLELNIMRDGHAQQLHLDLSKMGLPASTAGFPSEGALAQRMHADIISFLLRTQRSDGRWENNGRATTQSCWAGLALLSTHDPTHGRALRRLADGLLSQYSDPSQVGGYWDVAFIGIFLAEWHLASGDPRPLPWLRTALQWAAASSNTDLWDHQTFGHGPGGLPYENKGLVAPMSHLLLMAGLAKQAGLTREADQFFNLCLPMLRHTWSDPAAGGHGLMGYNASYKDLEEFWSRSGQIAGALALLDREEGMRQALCAGMREHHAWMRGSHAYGCPGDGWGLLGLMGADRQAGETVLSAWDWSLLGAWQPNYGLRFSMPHMGAPYMGEEGLVNPVRLAMALAPHQGLFTCGGRQKNWLPVPVSDSLPTQLTCLRLPDGRIAFRSADGFEIRWTLTGAQPTGTDPSSDRPPALPHGGWLTARVFDERGRGGATRTFVLPPAPLPATLVSATGGFDAADSLRRAAFAIDGNPSTPWLTDFGEKAPTFPFEIALELGATHSIGSITLANAATPLGVRDVDIQFDDAPAQTLPVAFDGTVDLPATQTAHRVRLIFKAGRSADQRGLSIGEITLHPPTPTLVLTNGQVSAKCPKGTVLRYRTDGAMPSMADPQWTEPLAVTAGEIIAVRSFQGEIGGGATLLPILMPWVAVSAQADSESTGIEKAAMAIDGKPETFWHSRWQGLVAPLPHTLTLDLGCVRPLGSMRYLPREGGGNGAIRDYQVEASADGTLYTPVASGSFPASDAAQEIALPGNTNARYVRLVAKSSQQGNTLTSVAELHVLPPMPRLSAAAVNTWWPPAAVSLNMPPLPPATHAPATGPTAAPGLSPWKIMMSAMITAGLLATLLYWLGREPKKTKSKPPNH